MFLKTAAIAGAFAAMGFVAAAESPPSATDAESVVVNAAPVSEERLVGENQQPEWTAYRRFSTTRIYVLPPWQFEFEQWWKGKFPDEGKSEHLFQSEVEVGLPYRFQIDFYENIENTADDTTRHSGNQIEMRWALAEWGKILLNPTLYGEWKLNDHAPDAFELKLLFGEELAPRWHWGFNIFYEQEINGARTTEAGFSQAVSYTLLDSKLSVGAEMNFERTTEKGSRGEPEIEFLIGPSIQWRATPRAHIDLVPLFGTTRDSPIVEAYLILAFELGKSRDRISAPVSTGSR